MATFKELPNELLTNICRYLDPKSLAKLSQTNRSLRSLTSDDILWKQVALKEKHQNSKLGNLKAQAIFLEAFWYSLKKKYRSQHPLSQVIKELESSLHSLNNEEESYLWEIISLEQDEEKKINYVKAIILSSDLHQALLKHHFNKWVCLLRKIFHRNPEIAILLIRSAPFQKHILSSSSGDLDLFLILEKSHEGTVYFFEKQLLKDWREKVFAKDIHMKGSWYALRFNKPSEKR